MRAVRVTEHGGPETLEPADVPRPEPGPGELRVAVAAAGLNFVDVEVRRGNYPESPAPPFIAGREAAGRVDAVGADVERSVGERVVCLCEGAFAEYAVAPAERVFDSPPTGPVEAAGVPVGFLTAHNCLHEWGGLSADETVLVLAAAGGVGSAAVQLADAAGATVVGAAGAPEKLDAVREFGGDHAVDYERHDLAGAVEEATGGVDLALDGVGGDVFRDAVRCLNDGGRVVTYGMASGRPGSVATPRLFFGNRSVLGYHLVAALETTPGRVAAAVEPLYRLLEDGSVSVRVDGRFALGEVRAAYRRLEGRESRGKVLVIP